jgi:hypothetical protein
MSYLAMLKAAKERLGLYEINERRTLLPPKEEGEATKETKLRKKPMAWRPSYAHPWPDELPGLGFRRIGPFDSCVGCGCGSWARYGAAVLCCPCAVARAEG